MEPTNLNGSVRDASLLLSWSVLGAPYAILVSLAGDPEFTTGLRTFILPVVSSCGIECGTGLWYFRIGAMVGDPHNGTVKWSGIMGPLLVSALRDVLPQKPATVAVVHSAALPDAIRIHTNSSAPKYAFLEYTTEPQFIASKTHWNYTYDVGRGFVDCKGPLFPNVYNVRMTMFDEPHALPKDRMKQLHVGQIVKGKAPAARLRTGDSGVRTTQKADEALLQEGRARTNMKFATHGDYLRYKAAATRSSEEVKRVDRPAHYK